MKMMNKGKLIIISGPSGAGKSTIANELEKRLFAMGKHTMLLDGDNVRMGLNKDLGLYYFFGGMNKRIESIKLKVLNKQYVKI